MTYDLPSLYGCTVKAKRERKPQCLCGLTSLSTGIHHLFRRLFIALPAAIPLAGQGAITILDKRLLQLAMAIHHEGTIVSDRFSMRHTCKHQGLCSSGAG